MSWVFDHAGRIAFKGGWTVAQDLRQALESVLQARHLKREGGRGTPYYKETMGYRADQEGLPAIPEQTRCHQRTCHNTPD